MPWWNPFRRTGAKAVREPQPLGSDTTELLYALGATPEAAPVIERMHHTFITRLARATGRPAEQLRRDCEAERTLSAEEAVRYGLVDQLLAPDVLTF
ncbi:ATP-dependent Clp protease proteolytic subunit [Corallococcus sp. EGB]|uniref:ATP-dependent Clp protease proteolytic subunit n=1 Tax=Corallococcus sp. EGB TaxID=1521117 RepID=UPI001CBC655E|nr:ATP-dependent Clp protease proteolytic subunit [Corallococcus sp. EGB]